MPQPHYGLSSSPPGVRMTCRRQVESADRRPLEPRALDDLPVVPKGLDRWGGVPVLLDEFRPVSPILPRRGYSRGISSTNSYSHRFHLVLSRSSRQMGFSQKSSSRSRMLFFPRSASGRRIGLTMQPVTDIEIISSLCGLALSSPALPRQVCQRPRHDGCMRGLHPCRRETGRSPFHLTVSAVKSGIHEGPFLFSETLRTCCDQVRESSQNIVHRLSVPLNSCLDFAEHVRYLSGSLESPLAIASVPILSMVYAGGSCPLRMRGAVKMKNALFPLAKALLYRELSRDFFTAGKPLDLRDESERAAQIVDGGWTSE